MGLAERFGVFGEVFWEVCDRFGSCFDRPLRDVICAEPGSPDGGLLDQTAYTQAGLFTLEVALAQLLDHWGVRPEVLIGHSIGEVTAAHVGGVLSLEDAVTLVAARGRLMGALPAGGAMVAIEATPHDVTESLSDQVGIQIAAINGPRSVVISGDHQVVADLAAWWAERGARTKQLQVSHVFHSHLMDPMLDEFTAVAATLDYHPARIPIISNLTGQLATNDEHTNPNYWVQHIRNTVDFATGTSTAHTHGITHYLEVGPGATLTALTNTTLEHTNPTTIATLRPTHPKPHAAITALAQLHTTGTPTNITNLHPNPPHHPPNSPPTPSNTTTTGSPPNPPPHQPNTPTPSPPSNSPASANRTMTRLPPPIDRPSSSNSMG